MSADLKQRITQGTLSLAPMLVAEALHDDNYRLYEHAYCPSCLSNISQITFENLERYTCNSCKAELVFCYWTLNKGTLSHLQ